MKSNFNEEQVRYIVLCDGRQRTCVHAQKAWHEYTAPVSYLCAFAWPRQLAVKVALPAELEHTFHKGANLALGNTKTLTKTF